MGGVLLAEGVRLAGRQAVLRLFEALVGRVELHANCANAASLIRGLAQFTAYVVDTRGLGAEGSEFVAFRILDLRPVVRRGRAHLLFEGIGQGEERLPAGRREAHGVRGGLLRLVGTLLELVAEFVAIRSRCDFLRGECVFFLAGIGRRFGQRFKLALGDLRIEVAPLLLREEVILGEFLPARPAVLLTRKALELLGQLLRLLGQGAGLGHGDGRSFAGRRRRRQIGLKLLVIFLRGRSHAEQSVLFRCGGGLAVRRLNQFGAILPQAIERRHRLNQDAESRVFVLELANDRVEVGGEALEFVA